MSIYVKSVAADFPYGISAYMLRKEILAAGVTICTAVNIASDVVTIYFSADYTANAAAIDTVITNHRPIPTCFEDLRFVSIAAGDSPYQMVAKSVSADASGGNITVKMPKPQRMNKFIFAVYKTSALGTVTVLPFASELVDGGASIALSNYKAYVLLSSDGTNWNRIGDNVDVRVNVNMSNTTAKGDLRVDDGTELSTLLTGPNGYILTADSTQPVGLKWAPAGGPSLTACTEVTAVGAASTTSAAYVTVSGMSITPAAGTYFVVFSTTANGSNSSANIYCAINAGSVVVESERYYKSSSSNTWTMFTQAKVTVNGSTAITAVVKTSAGTLALGARTLSIIAVV